MDPELKEIELLSRRIINAIKISPSKCVTLFEDILRGNNPDSLSFDEYLNQLRKTLKVCTCQSTWNNNQILIHCLDCQKSSNSCICVNCFLKGNHQGHKILITHASSASCDCGDPLFWSPSGFCSDHPGPEPNPEKTQLTKETRVKLIAIAIAALSNYVALASTGSPFFNDITDFLSKVVSIGDATRRCVCIGFQYSIRFLELYASCCTLKKPEMNKLLKFLGSLTNDEIFRNYFSYSLLNDLQYFINFNDNFAKMTQYSNESQIKLFQFTFHGVSFPQICELIQKKNFNWKAIFINSLNLLLYYNFSNLSNDYYQRSLYNESISRIFTIFKSAIFVLGNKNPFVIQMVDEISFVLIKYEFSFPINRALGREKLTDLKKIQSCQFSIYYQLFQLVSKIDKNKIFTENPLKLIQKFFETPLFQSIDFTKRGFYYKSVLDGVPFAQSFPTFLLAFDCLNLKEGKKLYDIIKSVNPDVETFIKNWAVIPLRFYAASILSHIRLFERNDNETISVLNSFDHRKNIKIKLVPTFALLQTLLKTTKNVDDFLLLIISTFGFFNSVLKLEKLDENQNQLLLLSIFHFVLCLIFDTLCYEKNFFTMRRLTIISQLMKSDLNVEEINSVWYNKVLNDDKFCEELSNFTTIVRTKNGSKFHLTENSEWHPLLPFLPISSIIPLIQKFIHDNPESLINFPEIPTDSISLLFSPTLWALEYFILNQNCCKDYAIIHQLVFNTLIITSQNSEQYYRNENNFDKNESVLKVNDFNDLVLKLKKFTFNEFLKKKIYLNGIEKSMVDLISVHGNIGITVLTRLNISIVNDRNPEENQQKKEEMLKKKRERAKLMKKQIMSNFNKKQKSFQTSSEITEEQNNENSEKMECMICHLENEKDCFVYPALVIKSPLASYIKWRYQNSQLINNNKNSEVVNSNNFSEMPESFDLFDFVRICLHPIHSKCIKTKTFSCPTDRCPRNSSIPIIADIYDNQSELNQTVFLQASKFLRKAYHNDLKIAIYSFASQIEILEMRHRSNPGCLDDKTIQATLRNIYLCMYHVMKKGVQRIIFVEEFKKQKEILSKEEETKIKLPKRLLNPMNSFSSNFKNYFSSPSSFSLSKNKKQDDKDEDESKDKDKDKDDDSDYVSKVKNMDLSPFMFYILFSLIDLNKKDQLSMDDFIRGNFALFSDQCLFNIQDDLNNDYKMLQFLRCAVIFDHFARGEKITSNKAENSNEFIDWDAILSPTNLCKHFNIKNVFSFDKSDTAETSKQISQNDNQNSNKSNSENNNDNNNNSNDSSNNNNSNESNGENNNNNNNSNDSSNINSNDSNIINSSVNNGNDSINGADIGCPRQENEMTLPMFSFIDLPKNFLDFIHPPYSAPILEHEEIEVGICLLTGTTVVLNSLLQSESSKYTTLSDYLKTKFSKSFSVFLKLNGNNASEVVVADLKIDRVLPLRTFYVDKFGDKDIGMNRGSLLYLNEADKEEDIDSILSGVWTNFAHFV